MALEDSAKPLTGSGGRALDATDRAIMRVLQQSPDASNRQIAGEVGVQEATVARRIRDLVTAQYIRVTVQTNARAHGRNVFGFFDIEIEASHRTEIGKRLSEFDEVFSVHTFADTPQVTAIVMASSQDQFFDFARNVVAKMEGVRDVKAAQSLRMVKYRTHVSSLRTAR